MSDQTLGNTKKIVVSLVVLAALLMITIVPNIITSMVNSINTGLADSIIKLMEEGSPDSIAKAQGRAVAIWQIGLLYVIWANLCFVAGLTILVVIKQFYQGKAWARGLVLFCLAIAAVAGAYTIVAWINIVNRVQPGIPPSLYVILIALIPFFTVLLADKVDRMKKTIDAIVFLLIGTLSGAVFIISAHAFKAVYSYPKRPLLEDGTPTLWLAMGIGSLLLLISIYQLGARLASGWYMALIGSLVTLVSCGATQLIRQPNNNYLYTAIGALAVIIVLLLPKVRSQYLRQTLSNSIPQSDIPSTM